MSFNATRLLRVGALGAVALFAGTALAPASRAEPSGPGDSLSQLRAGLADLGVPVPTERSLAVRVQRLALAAERKRTRFPVGGAFNWGQGGARYGASRSGHTHEGQDVFARTGTPLLAVTDGVVLETGNDGGRGNYVGLYDPAARRTYVYLHMVRPPNVKAGDRVRAGEWLGGVGCTGSCFGDHLHFEVRSGRALTGAPRDPLPLLQHWADLARLGPTLAPGQS